MWHQLAFVLTLAFTLAFQYYLTPEDIGNQTKVSSNHS